MKIVYTFKEFEGMAGLVNELMPVEMKQANGLLFLNAVKGLQMQQQEGLQIVEIDEAHETIAVVYNEEVLLAVMNAFKKHTGVINAIVDMVSAAAKLCKGLLKDLKADIDSNVTAVLEKKDSVVH